MLRLRHVDKSNYVSRVYIIYYYKSRLAVLHRFSSTVRLTVIRTMFLGNVSGEVTEVMFCVV